MANLDHLGLNAADAKRTAEWYCSVLGLVVEFENADPVIVGVKDEGEFSLLFSQIPGEASKCSLFFRVDDVDATYDRLSDGGVGFENGPRVNPWGYGAELRDPDGRLVGLWDQASMEAHSGG
jgi:catechol 2,3-dioxygenase-like lactoylglutathione lyase family enzyme